MEMIKVKFKQWDCVIKAARYHSNNRTALTLYDAEDFQVVAVATINLPDMPLQDDEVYIKDYSENEGMVKALRKAGVISKPIGYVNVEYVKIPKCKLLIQPG